MDLPIGFPAGPLSATIDVETHADADRLSDHRAIEAALQTTPKDVEDTRQQQKPSPNAAKKPQSRSNRVSNTSGTPRQDDREFLQILLQRYGVIHGSVVIKLSGERSQPAVDVELLQFGAGSPLLP